MHTTLQMRGLLCAGERCRHRCSRDLARGMHIGGSLAVPGITETHVVLPSRLKGLAFLDTV